MATSSAKEFRSFDLGKLEPIYDQFADILASGREKTDSALIPVLQKAQDTYGYLPEQVLDSIADRLNIPISRIYGVVTFYSQFHLEPRGKHIIRSCQGTACHVRNASRIMEALQNDLDVEAGRTTKDLQFTLETVACIGACSLAPVMMVDSDIHERLNVDRIPKILDLYRNN